MLFQELDKLKRNVIMVTILFIFTGLVLMLIPENYIPFLGSALGFCFLVLMIFAIFDFITSKRALIHYIYLVAGLLAGVIGIALLTFDGLFISIMTWLVAIIPIIGGVLGIVHTLTIAKRSGRQGWWILIILSGFLMAFGGFVFWNPWMESPQAILQIIGGTLMYSAIVSGLSLIWLWPAHVSTGGK